MAKLNKENISKIEKERNLVHDEVEATYTVFTKDGDVYFQIDTYGKPGREIPGKISQSIQFDQDTAKFLVQLLADTFNMTFKIS